MIPNVPAIIIFKKKILIFTRLLIRGTFPNKNAYGHTRPTTFKIYTILISDTQEPTLYYHLKYFVVFCVSNLQYARKTQIVIPNVKITK